MNENEIKNKQIEEIKESVINKLRNLFGKAKDDLKIKEKLDRLINEYIPNILKNNDIYDINISENNNQISYKLKNENIEYLIIHNNSYNVDKLLNLDISSYKIYLNTSNNNNTNNPWQTLILFK